MGASEAFGIDEQGRMAAGRARAHITGGFAWRAPADSGVAFVVEPPDEAGGAAGLGALVLGAAFWLGVAAMTMVSFQSPHGPPARVHRASAASRPVFVPQPTVASGELQPPSVSTAQALFVPVASAVKVAGDAGAQGGERADRTRPRRREAGGMPSAGTAAAPRAATAKSAPIDDENALAVDTLSRSRLERTF